MHGWLISTRQLAELLEISIETLTQQETWDQYGFDCARAGMNGKEMAWRLWLKSVSH